MMKNILVVFFALFLLVGCGAFADVNKTESKKEQLKLSNTETVQKLPDKEELKILKTAKPILCIDQTKVLTHLDSIGEKPLATWYDETIGYPVILLVNRETGTASLLEYPAMGNMPSETFEGYACLVAHGIGVKVFDDKPKINTVYTKKMKKILDNINMIWYK